MKKNKKVFLDPKEDLFFKRATKVKRVTTGMVHGLSGGEMYLVLKYFQKHQPLVEMSLHGPKFSRKNRGALLQVLRRQKQCDITSKSILKGKKILFENGTLKHSILFLLVEGVRYPAWYMAVLFLLESSKKRPNYSSCFNSLAEQPVQIRMRIINYLYIFGMRDVIKKIDLVFFEDLTPCDYLVALGYACSPFKVFLKDEGHNC